MTLTESRVDFCRVPSNIKCVYIIKKEKLYFGEIFGLVSYFYGLLAFFTNGKTRSSSHFFLKCKKYSLKRVLEL